MRLHIPLNWIVTGVLVIAIYYLVGLGMSSPAWICTTYKVDYTAVAIIAATVTFLLEWRERHQRLLSSRKAVQSLAVLELQNLIALTNKLLALLPREDNQGLDPRLITTEHVLQDKVALINLETTAYGLATPIMNSHIEKLDALQSQDLAKIGQISNLISTIKRMPERVNLILRSGAKGAAESADIIDDMVEKCRVLVRELHALSEKWNKELQVPV